MKKTIILLCVVAMAALAMACNEANSSPVTKKTEEIKKVVETPKPSPQPVEYVAQEIALSKLETEFIKKPDCDGGECMRVNFTVGFKLTGNDAQIFTHRVNETGFTYVVGDAKKDEDVLKATQMHKTLGIIDPKKVMVTLTDGKVTKISTIEEMKGKELVPAEVLWEQKQY